MTNNESSSDKAADLRRQAEEMVRENAAQTPQDLASLSPEEIQNTLHELRVHQIELEMQNEEMQRTQFELKTAHERYFSLYDLAPVGYVTLNEKGLILEANLTASGLLGVARGALIKQPFSHFILREDQDIYYLYHKRLCESGEAQDSDLRMVKKDGTTFWAHLKATATQGGDSVPLVHAVISDITASKRTEQALCESEDKFKYVFDHDSVGKSLTLPTGEISVNQAMCDMLGYSQEEIKTLKWQEISHPEDLELTQNEINALLAGEKETAHFNKRYLQKKGSVVWTDISTALRRDKDGQPLYFMTTINYISERMKAEEALKANEEKYRTLIEQSIDGIVISDEHGNIVFWNKGTESITGINACDTIGAPLWKVQAQLIPDEIKTPGLLEQLRTGMENIIQSKIDWQGESREQTIICADGKRKTVLDSTFIIKTNNTVRIGTILHDITEHKLAEEKQKESILKLQLAMQSANMAWWEMDITSGQVTFEKRKAEMLGYAPEKFHHYNDFVALLHPEDNEKAMDAMRKHIEGSLVKYEAEYRILNNSGEYKWFYDIGAIVKRDLKGNPLNVAGLVMDISERKQAEEEVRRLNENLEKRVAERTAELRGLVNAMAGREVRMTELKEVIHQLRDQLEQSGLTPVADDPLAKL